MALQAHSDCLTTMATATTVTAPDCPPAVTGEALGEPYALDHARCPASTD